MTTRQAIEEMRKRGYSGIGIITAARATQIYATMKGNRIGMADALRWYVCYWFDLCANCGNKHHIQQCGELSYWMQASEASWQAFVKQQENAQ